MVKFKAGNNIFTIIFVAFVFDLGRHTLMKKGVALHQGKSVVTVWGLGEMQSDFRWIAALFSPSDDRGGYSGFLLCPRDTVEKSQFFLLLTIAATSWEQSQSGGTAASTNKIIINFARVMQSTDWSGQDYKRERFLVAVVETMMNLWWFCNLHYGKQRLGTLWRFINSDDLFDSCDSLQNLWIDGIWSRVYYFLIITFKGKSIFNVWW